METSCAVIFTLPPPRRKKSMRMACSADAISGLQWCNLQIWSPKDISKYLPSLPSFNFCNTILMTASHRLLANSRMESAYLTIHWVKNLSPVSWLNTLDNSHAYPWQKLIIKCHYWQLPSMHQITMQINLNIAFFH